MFGRKDRYDPDEAFRVSAVTIEFEGDQYLFRVKNSEHRFVVILVEHRVANGNIHVNQYDLMEGGFDPCKHAGPHLEPCTAEGTDLKEACRSSILEHQKRFHSLRVVS